jgi:hypothetical protein
LSNDEPVVGFTSINWVVSSNEGVTPSISVSVGSGGVNATRVSLRSSSSDTIRIPGRSAIELGAVLSEPAAQVTITPYISLNRDTFTAGRLDTSSIPDRNVEPFDGVREIPFDFDEGDRIVADDLDETFSIVTETGENTMRLSGRSTGALDLDQGLPVATGVAPSQWSRRTQASSFGRYRHTFAYVGAGDGRMKAVMPVQIPAAGRWELEIHDPGALMNFRGTLDLEIVTADGRESVSFDPSLGSSGWNLVGEFQLPAGEVAVEISDRTDGRMVIADAIGWSPVGTQNQAQGSNSP